MSDGKNGSLVLLLVEDNPADVAFFREALAAAQVPALVSRAGDGDEALRFLRRQPPFTDAPRPDVIILDLNLPRMSGREVMAQLQADEDLKSIPIAVMTGGDGEQNVCQTYPGVRCMHAGKTDDFHRLVELVKQMVQFARPR